jgi:amino acid transporter
VLSSNLVLYAFLLAVAGGVILVRAAQPALRRSLGRRGYARLGAAVCLVGLGWTTATLSVPSPANPVGWFLCAVWTFALVDAARHPRRR